MRSNTDSQISPLREVALVFLRLGCTSFGGPVAHLGYFQKECVEGRRWCSQAAYADIVALAQALPGPASSQVGFALGVLRAGWLGGIVAWTAFTLPSAVLMVALAFGYRFTGTPVGGNIVHALEVVAVAVVAQAVLSMQSTLAPDLLRLSFAVAAAAIVFFVPMSYATLIAMSLGALAGFFWYKPPQSGPEWPLAASRRVALVSAGVFVALLGILPLLARVTGLPALRLLASFYRSGALVFGGGHVVLPLLERAIVTPGYVSQTTFLAGYGAAQALPGPLFSIGAYLGAAAHAGSPSIGFALLGLVGLFAPGLLVMAALLPFWSRVRPMRLVRAALGGVNAAVVGVLFATFCRPLWTSTIRNNADIVAALGMLALLVLAKVPPWTIVIAAATIAAVSAVL